MIYVKWKIIAVLFFITVVIESLYIATTTNQWASFIVCVCGFILGLIYGRIKKI